MKPAYVSVEYWRESRDDTATIEGWLTTDFLETRHVLITPSLDYDETIIKIGIVWDKVISITPAQSVREYGVESSWKTVARIGDNNIYIRSHEDGSLEEIKLDDK